MNIFREDGKIYMSSEEYVRLRAARCHCSEIAVDVINGLAVCRVHREERVMTGSWLVA